MAQKKLSFDLRKDYAPITQLTSQVLLLLATPTLQATSVQGLIAYAKARPGAVTLGSSGNGSIAHAGLELFNSMAQISIVHVPYKGIGPALTDLLGGQLQLAFPTSVSGAPYVKGGKLKALAATGTRRLPSLPDVPTFSESGVPLELDDWFGVYAPGKTPTTVIYRLHGDIKNALSSAEVRARFGGADVAPSAAPADAARKIADDIARWEKIVRIPSFASELR